MVFFADTVLEYFDSGLGPLPGPYGFVDPNGNGLIEPGEPGVGTISLNVVLGDEEFPSVDALSLPTGSFITVGFQNELIIDGPGNDIFIREVGAAGDRANVFVSADGVNFTFLGLAQDNVTTAFDLASVGFTEPVQAVRIVGLDNQGASPGFDVANVQALQSIINGRRLIFTGTIEIDIMIGLNFRDDLRGLSGNDRIFGRDGGDFLRGDDGNDRIFGGNGRDLLSGGLGRDRLFGGWGNDVLRGGRGRDLCWGGADDDRIRGGGSDDRLDGGDGDDVLFGGRGDDVLIGGEGDDKLFGGRGDDVYVIGRNTGADTIYGFEDGRDRIRLLNGLKFEDLSISDEGDNSTVISVDDQTIATLIGIRSDLITAADFS